MNLQAIRYSRFSTEKQEKGDSLTRQKLACESMAERKGWVIERAIEDLGRSAWHGHHLRDGNLGRFANEVRSGSIPAGTILIVEKTDRLSRQGAMALFDWLRDMANHGLRIAIADGDHVFEAQSFNGDPLPILTIILNGRQDKAYSDGISDRVGSAWVRKREEAVANHTLISRRVPGWIDLAKDGTRTLNPVRTPIVLQIFQWTADGIGAPTIVKRLNLAGVKPWGHFHKVKAGWETSYIGQLINGINVEGDYQPMKRVKGKLVPAGDKIEGYYPRAVPAALVAQARAARASRRHTGGAFRCEFKYLTTGMMRCHECGAAMSHAESKVGGVRRLSVRCYSVMRGMACGNRGLLRYERFETTLLDRLLPLALDDQFFARSDDTFALANEVATLEKLIADRTAFRDRQINLAGMVDDPTAIVAKINEVNAIITTTEKRLQEARDALQAARGSVGPDEHLRRVLEVRGAIEDADPVVRAEARMKVHHALRAVVQTILCDNDDDGRKTFRVALIGGLIGWRIDAQTGEVINQWNITGRLDANPQLAVGAMGQRQSVLRDVLRRQG